MSVIGVYDSGIGGLTVLSRMLSALPCHDFIYFADNLNGPLGNKRRDEIRRAALEGIKYLRARCDVVALGCNTASSATDDLRDVIKLLPPTDFSGDMPTLLLATNATLSALSAEKMTGIYVAHTPELAGMIEDIAERTYPRPDFGELHDYLAERLTPFRGVKRVVLGCSHYPYCKAQMREILGDVEFCDGSGETLRQLADSVADGETLRDITDSVGSGEETEKRLTTDMCSIENEEGANRKGGGNITYAFSGRDEHKKYRALTRYLLESGC